MPNCSYNNGNADSHFKFTGKELDQELDINLYYFGARYYDPQLGRWHVVDPADEFNSPYTYVGNNPIYFVDKNGNHGIGFNFELDWFDESGSLIVSFEFGDWDKFQVGILYNEGQYKYTDNDNYNWYPTGSNVGLGINPIFMINSKDLSDWIGHSKEVDINAGKVNLQLATSKIDSYRTYQIGILGVGLGVGADYQENYTKFLGGIDFGELKKCIEDLIFSPVIFFETFKINDYYILIHHLKEPIVIVGDPYPLPPEIEKQYLNE